MPPDQYSQMIKHLTRRKQMDKVLEDIENLKDKARDMHYKNGNGQ